MRSLVITTNIVMEPDYIVYKSGSTYYALSNNGPTSSNSNFGTLINTLASTLNSAGNGGTIYIRRGVYNCGPSVRPDTFCDKLSIIGAGKGQTILKRTYTSNDTTIKLHGNFNTLAHLTIDGDRGTAPTNDFAEVDVNGTDFTCYDVEFKNWQNIAILHQGGSRHKFKDCVFTGVVGNTTNVDRYSAYGIYHWQPANTDFTEITGCTFMWMTRGAFAASGTTICTNCYFSDNSVENGGQTGGDNAQYTVVKGCVFAPGNVGSYGIEFTSGDWVFTDNYMQGQHFGGILLWGHCKSAVITNNEIYGMGTFDGVIAIGPFSTFPESNNHFIISNNIIHDNARYAIHVDSRATNFTITNNMFYNNPSGHIHDETSAGANKIISGNNSS